MCLTNFDFGGRCYAIFIGWCFALTDVIAIYVVVDGKPVVYHLPQHYPKSNITREEQKVLAELRRHKNRIILTADKGVSMMVMDKEDYIRKAEELLDQPAYRSIPTDCTTKYKNKLISLLKTIKTEGGSIKSLTEGSTLQGQVPLNSMGCPRYTKKGCHSNP